MSTTPFTATVLGSPRIGPNRELKKAVEAYWAGRLDAAGLWPTSAPTCAAGPGPRCATPGSIRSRSTPSPTTTRCSTPPSMLGALPDRVAGDLGRRPGPLLRRRPRHRRRRTAGDDEVVRHQLPLPGPGDRPGHRRSRLDPAKVLGELARGRAAGRRRPAGDHRAGDVPAADQGGRGAGRAARPARRTRRRCMPQLLRRARRRRRASGCRSTSRRWSRTDSRTEIAALAERVHRIWRRTADRPAIFVATVLRRAGRCAARAGRAAGRGDRPRPGRRARQLERLAVARASATRRSSPASSTAATSGAPTSRPRSAPLAALLGCAGLGGGVDVVLAAARALHARRRDRPRRRAAPLAGVRRREGRARSSPWPRRCARAATSPTAVARPPRSRRPHGRSAPARRADARPARTPLAAGGTARPAPSAPRRRRPRGCDLPPLPTTTIGSFPQTAEIRKARAALRPGEIDETEYARADAGRDRRRHRAAGGARPRRARARRARAQRHGAVLRRATRRVLRHRATAGCSRTAAAACGRRSCTATSADRSR